MKNTITVTTNGRITIPKWVRAELQLSPGDKVLLSTDGEAIFVKKQ
ncbi:AbrB/MazE/SpoVT family DNA-binding domain-containing protein [Candidatus Saccharibacteria bacterium]|nr:AbrB/MazE/SpoVT family DNA-binding domain-containing protein [Candidatus Saccharibacteria bacterium]